MSKFFDLKEFREAYEYIDDHRETTMKVLMRLDT